MSPIHYHRLPSGPGVQACDVDHENGHELPLDLTRPHRGKMPISVRYRLEGGELVRHPDGQWLHVGEVGIKTWVLDAPIPTRRETP